MINLKTSNNYNGKDLEFYKSEVGYLGKLTNIEELELITSFQEYNSNKCLDKLVKYNLPFVISVAKKYHNDSNIDINELVQSGLYGLIKGISDFDITSGNRLITYAVYKIRAEINNYLYNESNLIKIPFHHHAKNGGKITEYTTQFDAELFDDSGHDYTNETETTNDLEEENYNINILNALIKSNLDSREYYIIKNHFGLDGTEVLTLTEISKRLNISKSYVTQLKKYSLKILLERFEEDNLLELFKNLLCDLSL